ncbi:hypothetical protein ACLESD_42290 [Pyxidicoccus sp. 3LFB2]
MSPVQPDVNPPVSDTPPPAQGAEKPAKPSLTARFKTLMVEYGPLALVVNYTILALFLVGFQAAIKLGFQPTSTGQTAGTWAAAYAASRVTAPLRWSATLLLTPLIARIPPVARFIERHKHRWAM